MRDYREDAKVIAMQAMAMWAATLCAQRKNTYPQTLVDVWQAIEGVASGIALPEVKEFARAQWKAVIAEAESQILG